MLTRINIFRISISLILLALISIPFFYIYINKHIYKEKVTNYLLNEESYKLEELQSVKGVWGKKLPSFYALVVFKNEPLVEYVYFAHRPDNILQFSYRITEEGKQKGIIQSDLKHLVPS